MHRVGYKRPSCTVRIGAQTLSEIETTYQRLLGENRLVIPAQVAREFARNRVTKLVELHQKLSRRRSQLPAFQQGSYPLLETLPEYQRLREVENKLDEITSEYRQLLTSVIEQVNSWEWNDPVSLLYQKIFQAAIVTDTAKPLEDVQKEHLRRFANKIPPGYKDEAKEDRGVGDLLIWLTILEVGSSRRASVIFVSGEEKADWWHRSEGQQLYPRFELVDEFRRASEGQSFHIIKLSRLLELFGASIQVVAEVREEERATAPQVPLTIHADTSLRTIEVERSVASWLIESGYKVSPAPSQSGCDYLVEGPGGGIFAVDIIYVQGGRGRLIEMRLRHRTDRWRHRSSTFPLTVVVVTDSPEDLQRAELIWSSLDPPFRLCTDLLTSDGRFQVVRPL